MANLFLEREEEERERIIAEAWCNKCQDFNLGLDEPCQYEGNGMLILEGKCTECGNTVVSEIVA